MRWLIGSVSLSTRVAVLLSVNSGALQAQVVRGGLNAGAEVRIWPAPPAAARWVYGRLLRATADSVLLYTPGMPSDTLHFAATDLNRLELSLGRHSRAGHGAALGAAIGATIGLAIGLSAASCTNCYLEAGSAEVVMITAIGGAAGAGIGALIGLASHGERWAAIPRPWLTAGVAPSAGVVKVGLRIPW